MILNFNSGTAPTDMNWIRSVPVPLVIVSLGGREIVAANASAARLLAATEGDLVNSPSSHIIADYLLPEPDAVLDWVNDRRSGGSPGMWLDLLIERQGDAPVRANAHVGPLDADGKFVLVTLQQPGTVGPEAESGADHGEDDSEVLLGLLSDIGRIVGSSLDLDAVCQQFAISLMHVVPAEHVAILLFNDAGDSLDVLFSTGGNTPTQLSVSSDIEAVSRVVQSGSAVLLSEQEIMEVRSSGAAAWPYFDDSVLTACCVPLIASEECIGVVLLASALREAYSLDDLALLEYAGSQVAGAISNVKLHKRLEQDALERDVLASIGKRASAAIDLGRAMPGIAGDIKRFMPVSELWVVEPGGRTDALSAEYSWSETGTFSQLRRADSQERKSQDDDEDSPVKNRSSITVPLRFGGEEIGAFTAVLPDGQRHTDRETSFIALVAGQIAGAVHTARVYRNQQREVRLRQTLARISLAASRDLTPERVFERIGNEVAELIQYDLFVVAMQTPDQAGMAVRFQIGSEDVSSLYKSEQGVEGSVQHPWREQLVDTSVPDSRFTALVEQDVLSFMEVSLGNQENGASGYLLIGSTKADAFTERDLKTLSQVAAQVTPAIQNAIVHDQAVALAEARMAEARAEARSIELERISDAKSKFLSIVSHELRTPLTSIIAYAELLERNGAGTLNEKQVAQASVINKSASHLKFLISDLLDVSRIESGNLALEMTDFDLVEAVNDVADQFALVLEEKQQELEVHVATEPVQLRADRARIIQVLSNLVENASKYSPPDTTITLSLHRRGSEAVITVADEGIGIAGDDQEQLFVPFFRVNNDLTHTEPGTGLGLALVKSIAEMHSGSVSVKSAPGQGSTFTVVLKANADSQAA